ncbi:MAG: prepilin-type N-terminal cleavage/methylation domain-containing protein [Chthoniobacterales bacterium]|nr:prepilin-type N-terminal cleavage/methylation domain-containing protein [Chthoniobacterales bacterium]MBJ7391254.1 prepilin-type N-terminal cleavage/methylation domain-containing protein [Chthoniobacterales bacterium]
MSSPHDSRPKRPATAFTLIELLVVIAIIAILAAIAVPAYSSFIAGSKSAKCQSNLRQIGVAMIGYTSENNGMFPNDPTGENSWAKYLGPYIPTARGSDVGNVKDPVFRCPAETNLPPKDFSNSVNHYIATYTIFAGANQQSGARRLAAVLNPSQTLLMVDGRLNPQNNSGYNCNTACTYNAYNSDCGRSDRSTTENVAFRHKDTDMNALYVDGHVSTIPWPKRTNVTKVFWNGRN